MSNPPGPFELRITRHIAASAARVFDAWLNPATPIATHPGDHA